MNNFMSMQRFLGMCGKDEVIGFPSFIRIDLLGTDGHCWVAEEAYSNLRFFVGEYW